MNAFEPVVAKPLSEDVQTGVLAALGLGRFAFVYRERTGDQWVRYWLLSPEGQQSLFPTEAIPQEAQGLPTLTRTHFPHRLSETPLVDPFSLWDALLPFPFRLWGAQEPIETQGSLDWDGPEWREACQALRKGIDSLEARLHKKEISLLRIGGQRFFFHSVRRRFLTAGMIPLACETERFVKLGASFQDLHLAAPTVPSFTAQIRLILEEIEGLVGASVEHAERDSLLPTAPVVNSPKS